MTITEFVGGVLKNNMEVDTVQDEERLITVSER